MEWVETAGRTLAEAKDAALDQLGVDEVDAEFVIVSEPKVGLFGRTRGEARVRARVRPTQPRPKRGRERRPTTGRRRTSGGGREGAGGGTSTATRAEESPRESAGRTGIGGDEAPDKRARGPVASESNGTGRAGTNGRATAGGSGGAVSPTAPRRRRGGRGRGGGSGGGDSQGSASPAGTGEPGTADTAGGRDRTRRTGEGVVAGNGHRQGTAEQATRDMEKEAPVVEMSLEQQGEAARQFVAELVQTLGVTATVEAHPSDEETVSVAVEGEGVGTLIGPGGTTLQALQELTRTYVQKITGGQSDRILVDVAGYRARRVAALQRFTSGIAEEVVSSGEPRALEPMSAADRKVVHDTVNDIAGVETRSEGEDPRRYIVIVPDTSGEAS